MTLNQIEGQSPEKTKVRIFALDWDGCTDVLKSDPFIKFKNQYARHPRANLFAPNFEPIENGVRQALITRLTADAFPSDMRDSDKREILVGSSRQSKQIDKKLSIENINGECFKELPTLTETLKAEFFPYLVFDRVDPYLNPLDAPLFYGATMGWPNPDPESDGLPVDIKIPYRNKVDVNKTVLLREMLAMIDHRYPSSEYDVDLYFYEDMQRIISALNTWCTDVANQAQIPIHITLHLVHFDWFNIFQANISSQNPLDPENISTQMLSSIPQDIILPPQRHPLPLIEKVTNRLSSASLSDIGFFAEDNQKPDGSQILSTVAANQDENAQKQQSVSKAMDTNVSYKG